jgi:hypothetical protein
MNDELYNPYGIICMYAGIVIVVMGVPLAYLTAMRYHIGQICPEKDEGEDPEQWVNRRDDLCRQSRKSGQEKNNCKERRGSRELPTVVSTADNTSQAYTFKGKMGIVCDDESVVQKVSDNEPAHKEGITKGARIVNVDTAPYSKEELILTLTL